MIAGVPASGALFRADLFRLARRVGQRSPVIDPGPQESLLLCREWRALLGHFVRCEFFPQQARLGGGQSQCGTTVSPGEQVAALGHAQIPRRLVAPMTFAAVLCQQGSNIGFKGRASGGLGSPQALDTSQPQGNCQPTQHPHPSPH